MIYITSWQDLYPVADAVAATHVISLLGVEGVADTPKPVRPENHLQLDIDDIAYEIDGYIAPNRRHVAELIEFGESWRRQGPIICHCYAGISRSSAAALILLALYNPGQERMAAEQLRAQADHVQPNKRLIRFADEILGRDGALIAAAEAMGPGQFYGVNEAVGISVDLA
jgi:predicted protein tyrosine phosphatase